MSHLYDQDDQYLILHLVNYSVITDSHPVKFIFALQLNAIFGTWIFFEGINGYTQAQIKFFIRQRT